MPAYIEPGPGQESVWDYPRPPRIEQRHEEILVVLGGVAIAETTQAWCVLETSHPPTYYLPRTSFVAGSLRPAPGSSSCEWKGTATYLDVIGGDEVAAQAGWTYTAPTREYAALRDHVALYPAPMDGCFVDGERVAPQPGGFYGGWVTSRVTGPFKGAPGTMHW